MAVAHHDPYDGVYKSLPTAHHILQKVPNCEYCGAIKFPREGPGFCCRKGKVNIYTPDVPGDLLTCSQVRQIGMHCISERT